MRRRKKFLNKKVNRTDFLFYLNLFSKEMNIFFIENSSIKTIGLWKDGMNLLESAKLAQNFVYFLNNFD